MSDVFPKTMDFFKIISYKLRSSSSEDCSSCWA